MNLSTVEFFLREAWLNVRRSGLTGLTATTTVLVSLCFLGAYGLLVLNVDLMVRKEAERLDVRLFLKDRVSSRARRSLQQNLRRTPHVASVEFISRETALKQVQADLKTVDLSYLLQRRRNPFPEMFRVRIDPLSEVPALVEQWRGWREIGEVRYFDEAWRKLTALSRVLKALMAIVGAAAMLGVMIIIGNTIKLTIYARRRDLRVMQLVGATVWFIRVPFLLEGIAYGFVGALCTCVVLGVGYTQLIAYIRASYGAAYMPTMVTEGSALFRYYAGLVAAGAGFGALGSYLSMRRFVRNV